MFIVSNNTNECLYSFFANRNQTILFFQSRFGNTDINGRNTKWPHHDKLPLLNQVLQGLRWKHPAIWSWDMDNNPKDEWPHQRLLHTQLLRRILNIHWRDHNITNREVNGNLPPLSETLLCRETSSACRSLLRTDDKPSPLVFWNPPGGHPNRGRRKMSYTDTITPSPETLISIKPRPNN